MNHSKLLVWQKARVFCKTIYKTTEKFPSTEKFGLISQMRRAAVSIASNISEGSGRNSDNEFRYFLGIAQGSCSEIETQIYLSTDIGFIQPQRAQVLIENCQEIRKMISGLKKSFGRNG